MVNFIFMDKVEKCKKLYERYRELEDRCSFEVKGFSKGDSVNIQPISLGEHTEEIGKLREEIMSCIHLFDDQILYDLLRDDYFRKAVRKELKRRGLYVKIERCNLCTE